MSIRDTLAVAIAQQRVVRLLMRNGKELVGVPAAHPTRPRWFGVAITGEPLSYFHQYEIETADIDL